MTTTRKVRRKEKKDVDEEQDRDGEEKGKLGCLSPAAPALSLCWDSTNGTSGGREE
jgi:hypothetical protein